MNRFRASLLSHNRHLHQFQNAGPLCSHLKSRSVIRFSGPDTIKFLQGLLSNDIRRIGEPPREDNSPVPTPNVASVVVPPIYAALLTPQGRFLYDFFLYRPPRPEEKLDRTGSGPGSGSGGSVEILADVDGSVLDELLATLKRYRLRSKVDVENVAGDFSCWQRYGWNLSGKTPAVEEPEAASVGWGSGVDRSGKSASHGNDVGWQWFKDPRLDCLGFRGIFPSGTTPPLVESDKVADEENYLLWRLEKGVAEGSTEIPKGEAIPLEYNFVGLNASWIRTYRWREYFQVDLMAGTTVGIMLVPQAMSYAKLAGLEPIYGLYSGFVPIFIYAIFGSSRQLAIGPVALVSLLVSNVLAGIADSSGALYTELAILLALMVGILECIMGLLRLGWLIRFISHSVISGFTTASAIVIGLSQAKYFLGYEIDRSSKIVPIIKSIISGADEFSWPPFVMGSLLLAILQTMKHLGKSRKHLRFLRAMGPLTAVVLGTTFVKIYHPSSITLVGDIPQGLPSFSIPKSFQYAKSLIPTALLITGVAILESVGIAKALAAKNGYELDSNQELFGLGVANIFGSFFSAYPTTGSFSRSAVNHESGAKTGLSGIIMGIIMGCALLFLTPLFVYIPQCALAAIVIAAVITLVDYEEAIFLWRIDKKDFLLWTITATTTLFLGIEIGVLVGVGVSLAFVIHESANPHIAVLGRLPGTTVYRNFQQYPEAYTYNGIVIVRIDAPIYFANISYIKDRLREYEIVVDKSTRRGPEVERIYFVILEMAPVTYIDSSAVQALKDLYQEYKSRDIQIAISNPNREVVLTLSKSGVVELIGKEWYFVRVHDAVQVCLQHVQSIKEAPKASNPSLDENPSFFQRLLKQRGEDSSVAELESGNNNKPFDSKHSDPQSEPLLFRKS